MVAQSAAAKNWRRGASFLLAFRRRFTRRGGKGASDKWTRVTRKEAGIALLAKQLTF